MDLGRLLRHQEGVVSRHQVLAAGLCDAHIRRMIRRREWVRLFEGVYVDHTGSPSWLQRAWGATLLHAPAALDAGSALAAFGFGAPPGVVDLVVEARRRVDDPPGIRTTRTRCWERVVQHHLGPPRVRLEPAALVAASRAAGDDAAVALLGDLVQERRTTIARLNNALVDLPRLTRRRLISEVLGDVSSGAMSALERRYLRDVERAHGLPRGRRQVRVLCGGTVAVRDVEYAVQRLLVELDGRLGHELWRDRWADLDRDLVSLRHDRVTARVGWGQVLQPCRLADVMAGLLRVRGWEDRPRRCGPDCLLT